MHFTPSPVARRFGALALAALIPLGGIATPVPAIAAVGTTSTTTTLMPWQPDPKPVGIGTNITANVSPAVGTGTVVFYDVTGGGKVELGSAPTVDSTGVSIATWAVPADVPAGSYLLMAEFTGNDTYAVSDSSTAPFVVGPKPTATQVSVSGPYDGSGATAQKGDVLQVNVLVVDMGSHDGNQLPINGTVAIKLDGTQVASVSAPTNGTTVSTAAWALGPHTITAVYTSSDANFSGSTSSDWPINIVANTLDVSGVGVQYAVFYPYKDGYRDTDAIRGTRLETASVKIRIYSPAGSLIKQVAIASGIGNWSFVWTGRNSSGAMLAAGKYTVRQTVTDAHGLAKTYTSYITLSPKRLYTYTVALKKSVSQKSAGSLSSGWLGWQFTLPSATVYKKLVFAVYGKSGVPLGLFGPHDYGTCSATTWNWYSCMAPWTTFPSSYSWKSLTGSVTRNRHGTSVRMYAVGGYRTAVAYARVTVTYAILK